MIRARFEIGCAKADPCSGLPNWHARNGFNHQESAALERAQQLFGGSVDGTELIAHHVHWQREGPIPPAEPIGGKSEFEIGNKNARGDLWLRFVDGSVIGGLGCEYIWVWHGKAVQVDRIDVLAPQSWPGSSEPVSAEA